MRVAILQPRQYCCSMALGRAAVFIAVVTRRARIALTNTNSECRMRLQMIRASEKTRMRVARPLTMPIFRALEVGLGLKQDFFFY